MIVNTGVSLTLGQEARSVLAEDVEMTCPQDAYGPGGFFYVPHLPNNL